MLAAYSDTNDIRALEDFVFISHYLISWPFEKKGVISRFSIEVEFRALAYVDWILKFLKEIHVNLPHPLTMFYDSLSADQLAKYLVLYSRIKHIEIDFLLCSRKGTRRKASCRVYT